MLDRIVNKLTSGRFLITVILTIVFAVLAINNRLSTEFLTIYTMLVAFYFGKERQDSTVNQTKEIYKAE
jgi:hypothetical protein